MNDIINTGIDSRIIHSATLSLNQNIHHSIPKKNNHTLNIRIVQEIFLPILPNNKINQIQYNNWLQKVKSGLL